MNVDLMEYTVDISKFVDNPLNGYPCGYGGCTNNIFIQ